MKNYDRQDAKIQLDRIDENASVLYVGKASYIIESTDRPDKWQAWGGGRNDDFHITKATRMLAVVACVWHATKEPAKPMRQAKVQRYTVELRAA